jgi:hypothetical protein
VDPHVRYMALLRMLSASIELSAALWMLRLGRVEAALSVNAALGLVGPLLFALVSAIGIAGLAGQVSWPKLAFIFSGVVLVLWGATHY